MTEKQKIRRLENLANIFWRILNDTGLSDGHCKHYDPLTIEKDGDGYMLHSYVFDYEDGGRHRWKQNLGQAEEWLIKSFEQWIERLDE